MQAVYGVESIFVNLTNFNIGVYSIRPLLTKFNIWARGQGAPRGGGRKSAPPRGGNFGNLTSQKCGRSARRRREISAI